MLFLGMMDRFPYIFIILGGIYTIMMLIGVLLMSNPPEGYGIATNIIDITDAHDTHEIKDLIRKSFEARRASSIISGAGGIIMKESRGDSILSFQSSEGAFTTYTHPIRFATYLETVKELTYDPKNVDDGIKQKYFKDRDELRKQKKNRPQSFDKIISKQNANRNKKKRTKKKYKKHDEDQNAGLLASMSETHTNEENEDSGDQYQSESNDNTSNSSSDGEIAGAKEKGIVTYEKGVIGAGNELKSNTNTTTRDGLLGSAKERKTDANGGNTDSMGYHSFSSFGAARNDTAGDMTLGTPESSLKDMKLHHSPYQTPKKSLVFFYLCFCFAFGWYELLVNNVDRSHSISFVFVLFFFFVWSYF